MADDKKNDDLNFDDSELNFDDLDSDFDNSSNTNTNTNNNSEQLVHDNISNNDGVLSDKKSYFSYLSKAIIFIAILVCAYFLYRFYFAPHTATLVSNNNNKPNVVTTHTLPLQPKVVHKADVDPNSQLKNQLTSMDSKLENNIKNISDKLATLEKLTESLNKFGIIRDDLSTVGALLGQLENKINKADKVVEVNNKNLQNIAEVLSQMLLAIRSMNDTVINQNKILNSFVKSTVGDLTAGAKSAGLTVEAIIPGRAWVRTKYGAAKTVTIGDEIPGYGKVVTIDSKIGQIVTNTGAILKLS